MQGQVLCVVTAGALLVCVGGGVAGAAAFQRTTHPDAQWFPEAGFGLFMHWGIHSVPGIQPSWAMIKDYPHGGDPRFHPPEKYYALAEQFNPDNYDPDVWMEAAARAGFTYAVLTAKHHDGYALWPTSYGEMSTRQYMGGRDLLRPYVEACRRHGLKVGLYFSPRDWSYPNYPLGDVDFDYSKRGQYETRDPEQNRREFEAFYEYTVGQLGELLTRYGKIDLLWFDGMGWHGISDIRTQETLGWIRDLQPGIVMNNRWGGVGDYGTPEWRFPDTRPGGTQGGWWEYCIAWNGHWGYNPGRPFRPTSWVLETLARTRAWGGNFLLNVGPAPDGTMPEGFYERCEELAAWMAHSKEAVIGTLPTPGDERANVPITRREEVWYLHALPGHEGPVELRGVAMPRRVVLLATDEQLGYDRDGDRLRINLPADRRTGLVDVIAVHWDRAP